jgi:SAM-dependent methyltransferase
LHPFEADSVYNYKAYPRKEKTMSDASQLKSAIQKYYGAIAGQSAEQTNSACCEPGAQAGTSLVSYADLESSLVEGTDLGLGCGTPTRYARLQPGETVLDLGSGAGIDVFLAAQAVGPQGRVIGVDMTPGMIAKARQIAAQKGYTNVDFRPGDIEALPVANASIDVVLSNCVINLAPDKRRVFQEIFRVLRPGGRFSISDTVTVGAVPDSVRADPALWSCCIGGAMDQDSYLRLIEETGFINLVIHQRTPYPGLDSQEYGIASLSLEAGKP